MSGKRRSEPGTLKWASRSPKGEQFIKQPYDLLQSPAWQTMPWATWKFVGFLQLQHMATKGECNGRLAAPYSRLVTAGIHKDAINGAIQDAIKRKLVERTREGAYRGNARGEPALYRLTYFPARKGTGGNDYLPPTHEWRDYKPADTAKRKPRVLLESDEILRPAANDS
jgi:hypothetical protein